MDNMEHIECLCPDCTESRHLFNEWADAFQARWSRAEREGKVARVCKWGCDGSGEVFVRDAEDDGHIEPCECRISHITGDGLPCGNVLCPTCGDSRDTSIDLYRLLHEVKA